MTATEKAIEYPSALQEYAVSAAEYLRLHPEYHVLCTGIVVFNKDGKLLLVQRAADEKAFPNFWEIPGGKVDDTDRSLLEAAARELKEEAGLDSVRVVGKVSEFSFEDNRPGRRPVKWLKLVFEIEVEDANHVVLDPTEHQQYVWATHGEIMGDLVGKVKLAYVSATNKEVKLQAFKLHAPALPL
ncbi:hypothetical protein ACN47E_006901 [Coniothyrium glycines]